MKFIHSADLHLDSPLRGLERYDGAPVADLRGATRQALENLVALAIEEQVAFVLIAGDVYDGDWRDYNTGLFFAKQMARLREARIPVFLIRGNHDAASQISRELRLPDNVTVFSSRHPETVRLDALGVAIHGQSFATQAVTEDLSAAYPAAVGGLFNIGLLHTSAGGREGHENYAPCTPAGLAAKGYDYWALGHVHAAEVLQRDPWIVFPGNLQGRHARETGSKGCQLVSVTAGRVVRVEPRALDVARWCRCEVEAEGANDSDGLLERVRARLQAELAGAEDRLLAVRLSVIGRCKAHASLALNPDAFINGCRALANDLGGGRVWLEKVILRTRAVLDLEALATRQDALGGLLRHIRALPADDQALQELVGELADLHQKLPAELRQGPDALGLDQPEVIRGWLAEVEQDLAPRLLESDHGA